MNHEIRVDLRIFGGWKTWAKMTKNMFPSNGGKKTW